MSKKVLKFSKQEFYDFLHETVEETLKHVLPLNELSVPLSFYKDKVDCLRFQLVDNWCLCKYCQLYDEDNLNKKHWAVELRACMFNLKKIDIKNGINKHKILEKMLVGDYDYDKANMIVRIINEKFNVEQIYDKKVRFDVAKEFADGIHNLINEISNDNSDINDYILNTFGIENKYKDGGQLGRHLCIFFLEVTEHRPDLKQLGHILDHIL